MREQLVIDQRGVERDVDAIVFGTGFHVTDMPIAESSAGAMDGVSEVWKGRPRAYLGATPCPGFPNLFMMLAQTPASATVRWST